MTSLKEPKMKTLVNRIVMVAASAMVLGTLAFGQTEMKAQIPFPFRTSMSTLPAGEYTVGQYSTRNGLPIATLQNHATAIKVFAPGGMVDRTNVGSWSVVFRCTDDKGCVLAAIKTRDGVISYSANSKSAREKEAALVIIPLRPVNAD